MHTFNQISVKLKTWKSSSKKIGSVKWRPYIVRAWYAWVFIIFNRFIHLSMPFYHIYIRSQSKGQSLFWRRVSIFLKTGLTHCSLVTPYGVSDWLNHLCLYCLFSLFNAKQLPDSMVVYCRLSSYEQTLVRVQAVGMPEQNFNFSCHIKQSFEIKVWV